MLYGQTIAGRAIHGEIQRPFVLKTTDLIGPRHVDIGNALCRASFRCDVRYRQCLAL